MARQWAALFPGSFDPFHEGHAFVVQAALRDFDRLYIVISWHDQKVRHHSFQSVFQTLVARYGSNPRIQIMINATELTTTLARRLKCWNLVRGYRNIADLVYEYHLAHQYLAQAPQLRLYYYHNSALKHLNATNLRQK